MLLFFDFILVDSESLIDSLEDFVELFLLCVSEFLILKGLLTLFDEDLLDFLRVFVLSKEVEEKVNIEFALSLIQKGLEHTNQRGVGQLLVKSGDLFHESQKLRSDGVVGFLVALVKQNNLVVFEKLLKVLKGDVLLVQDVLKELLHFLGLVEEHILFKALDQRVDVG